MIQRPLVALLCLVSLGTADEVLVKELDAGTSKDIAYVITSRSDSAGILYIRMTNRVPSDVRINFTIIPGPGDRGEETPRTVVCKKDSTWPTIGGGAFVSPFTHPGLRITSVECGTITEEYIEEIDSNGVQRTGVRRIFTAKSAEDCKATTVAEPADNREKANRLDAVKRLLERDRREKAEQEQMEKDRAEQARLLKEKADQDKLEKDKAEQGHNHK